jgi:hypothetical protein
MNTIHPQKKAQPAANTVLSMIKGPKRGRNWFDTVNDPSYQIVQTGNGTIALQGTNNVASRAVHADERNPVEFEILPIDGATWTDIVPATSASVSGTWSVQYEFIRLMVVTPDTGTGTVKALVRWN